VGEAVPQNGKKRKTNAFREKDKLRAITRITFLWFNQLLNAPICCSTRCSSRFSRKSAWFQIVKFNGKKNGFIFE
jgi:hypothetical protein